MASAETATTPPSRSICFDEKWKFSKRERSASRGSSSAGFPPATLPKSASFNSSSTKTRHRRCAFTRKCAKLVREQRARFYIMRRCVTMLICWRDYADS